MLPVRHSSNLSRDDSKSLKYKLDANRYSRFCQNHHYYSFVSLKARAAPKPMPCSLFLLVHSSSRICKLYRPPRLSILPAGKLSTPRHFQPKPISRFQLTCPCNTLGKLTINSSRPQTNLSSTTTGAHFDNTGRYFVRTAPWAVCGLFSRAIRTAACPRGS